MRSAGASIATWKRGGFGAATYPCQAAAASGEPTWRDGASATGAVEKNPAVFTDFESAVYISFMGF